MTLTVTDNERLVWFTLAQFGKVDGYLDYCCGTGERVRLMRVNGVRPSVGVDRHADLRERSVTPENVLIRDTTKRFDLNNSFELVVCVPDDFTLPEERYANLISNLVRHTEKWIVFAVNGQAVSAWKRAFESTKQVEIDDTMTLLFRTFLERSDVLVFKRTF